MRNVLLQASGSDFGLDFFRLLIFLAVIIGVFLVLRVLVLWYWKVDVIVSNQQQQINQNKAMIEQQQIIIDGLVAIKNNLNNEK